MIANYSTKEPQYTPKFIQKRNYDELNVHNINLCLDNSEILNSVFTSNDPEYIAESIQLELNTIYNTLAPSKMVQYKTNYIPYYNNEIREEIDNCNNMLPKAIL